DNRNNVDRALAASVAAEHDVAEARLAAVREQQRLFDEVARAQVDAEAARRLMKVRLAQISLFAHGLLVADRIADLADSQIDFYNLRQAEVEAMRRFHKAALGLDRFAGASGQAQTNGQVSKP